MITSNCLQKGTLLATLSLLCCPIVRADTHGHSHQLEPHVHGAATMNVAVEGQTLYMEMTSPAIDVVGFEHQPQTAEQEAAVEQAIATLENSQELFALPAAAGCRLLEATVATELSKDAEHAGEGHTHAGEAAHAHAEEGHTHAGEAKEAAEVHSEFQGAYRFECAQPQNLQQIGINLFSAFPSLETMDVQVLTDSGQTAVELTPAQPNLSL